MFLRNIDLYIEYLRKSEFSYFASQIEIYWQISWLIHHHDMVHDSATQISTYLVTSESLPNWCICMIKLRDDRKTVRGTWI